MIQYKKGGEYMIKITLNDVLNKRKMTISDLHKLTNISRSTLTPIVNKPNEVKSVQFETLNTICEALGIPLNEVIHFESESYIAVKDFILSNTKSNQEFQSFLIEIELIGLLKKARLFLKVNLIQTNVSKNSTILINLLDNFELQLLEDSYKYRDYINNFDIETYIYGRSHLSILRNEYYLLLVKYIIHFIIKNDLLELMNTEIYMSFGFKKGHDRFIASDFNLDEETFTIVYDKTELLLDVSYTDFSNI